TAAQTSAGRRHPHGGSCWRIGSGPTSPAPPLTPRRSSPPRTMPAARPVPSARNARSAPSPPRRWDAPSAATLRSLSTRTGTPPSSSDSASASAKRPPSMPRLTACVTEPSSGSTRPGTPTPTPSTSAASTPARRRTSRTARAALATTPCGPRTVGRRSDSCTAPSGPRYAASTLVPPMSRPTALPGPEGRGSRCDVAPGPGRPARAAAASPCGEAAVLRSLTSALHRTRDETAGHPTLDDEEEDHHGDRDEHRSRHDRPPVGRLRRLEERAPPDRQRHRVRARHDDERHDELVPGLDEREHARRDEARREQRERDPPERLAPRAAVDHGRLLELGRDAVDEPAQRPDREGQHAGDVDDPEADD